MKKMRVKHLSFLPVIIISFLTFKLITESDITFSGIFSLIYSCFAYFIWGGVIAYLFNPLVVFFDKLIASKKDSWSIKKAKRIFVISFLYLSFFGLFALFIVGIIPTISDGIEEITNKIPSYVLYIRNFSDKVAERTAFLPLNELLEKALSMLYDFLSDINLSDIYGYISSVLGGSALALVRLFFGFSISVYFLYSKENILSEAKKLLYALFSRSASLKISKALMSINEIFSDFLGGKLIESLIMFLLGAVVLWWLNIPLSAFISLIIAVTNIIPYFGPYIGAVPSILITLMFSPVKALWVLIYAVGIQLIDNFIIGPKVMSGHVGISPLLVILGVTVGGELFGIIGMFIGVPVVAAFKRVVYDSFIERRAEKEL
ncbi:MAG: AI-2E family transporter [Ruminococcaceae bacterium]|nr:AI-2E family transporter [Oscillospiraceae bacterium]